MDLLLELAERQRVDLGRISILQLTEQFLAGLERLERHVPLERRADWLVVATRLLLLRSRLLLPASAEAGVEAVAAAEQEVRRLDRLGVLRAAASGLARRPQLGLEVFARPHGRTPRVTSYMALMEACLVLLRGRDGQPGAWEPSYRPAAGTPFRVDAAMARIRALVGECGGEGVAFIRCLPVVRGDAALRGPRARAAVASSLVALLELARGGEVLAEQDAALAPIMVRQPADPNGAAVHAS